MKYVQANEPWLGEIPTGWRLAAIKRIVSTKVTDGPHETPELLDDGVQFISAEAIKNGNIDFDQRRGFISCELHEQYCRKCRPRRNDIFIIKSGATTGNAACVDVDFEFSIWSPLALMRCDERIAHYRFVYYVLLSDVFKKQVELSWSFGTQQNIGMGVIERLKLPLPPVDKQKRIATFLDASCAALDASVAAKRQQIETLCALKESLIESAITFGIRPGLRLKPVNEDWIADVPVHWQVCRIKRIVARVDYGISYGTEIEGRFPVLKMGHIQEGEIVFSNLDFVDEVSTDLLLVKGDLLYNRTNSHDQVGKAAIFRGNFSEPLTFASYLVRLRTNRKADPYWLNYVVNSRGFLGFARKLAIPSVQQANLNSTRYCRMLIPLPPLPEQKEIALFLDEKTAEIRGTVNILEKQISTLLAYRKSLIHECVTGQRRVKEEDLEQVSATAHQN